nr:hypothetical protein Iba_chr03eCG7310 [Ipomoea batatas]
MLDKSLRQLTSFQTRTPSTGICALCTHSGAKLLRLAVKVSKRKLSNGDVSQYFLQKREPKAWRSWKAWDERVRKIFCPDGAIIPMNKAAKFTNKMVVPGTNRGDSSNVNRPTLESSSLSSVSSLISVFPVAQWPIAFAGSTRQAHLLVHSQETQVGWDHNKEISNPYRGYLSRVDGDNPNESEPSLADESQKARDVVMGVERKESVGNE